MVLSIDMNVLTAYYQARAGVSGGLASGASSGGSASGAKKSPTPPWTTSSTAPQMSALTQTVLAGGKFINEGAAQLDVPKASADYKRLFALYQGLNALEGIVEQMNAKGTSDYRKNELRARFDAGMKEVSEYIDKTRFDGFQLAQGVTGEKLQSTGLVKRETDTYTTVPLHSGSVDTEVTAFQGPTAFSLKLQKPSGTAINVNFDLAEMGSTPRTMANVVLYMNAKLEAAGSFSRFAIERSEGAERTVQAGKETISLGPGPDTFALKFKGVSTEVPTFTAAATPAVYIGENVGTSGDQLVKFATDPASGATSNVDGKAFTKDLGEATVAVRASAVAADGSLYVLGDANAKPDGQAVKGMTDVVLRKYDSAGNLVFTRTLGAQQDASGYALAVSADGSRIAIAGSVTGALDNGELRTDATTADSFVTVFDAEGEEVFTHRRGATAADQVSALTFAADGALYVAGTTSSGIAGQTGQGGQDAYVQGFKPNAAGAASAYSQAFTVQYGTTGTDKVSGIAVNGSTLVVAGLENGDVVARRYDLQAAGAPVLGAVRNLGGVDGGTVAGVGIADDGSVLIAGSTHNGSLSAGSVTTAYTSGQAAFVAKLSADLNASGSERLTYYNGASDLTASAMTVSGGKVYVTGQQKAPPPPGQTTAFDGYAAAIDAGTGAVSWSQTFRGDGRIAAPTTIAVAAAGASVLDRLGLPNGTMDFIQSQSVVANTAVRPGDQFFVRVSGSTAKAVTIETGDTLKSVAAKINRAAGFNVKAEVVSANGYDTIKITPVSPRTTVEIESGPDGRNALKALGLEEGIVTTAADKNTKDRVKASYALQLPSTLNLDTEGYVKQAQAVLLTAMSTIKSIYKDMTYDPATEKKTGTVPAYLQNQIANYQQALNRLTGGG